MKKNFNNCKYHFKASNLFVLSILIIVCICFYGCSKAEDQNSEKNQRTIDEKNTISSNIRSEQLKIGGPKNIAMLVIIAEQKGYFSKMGVNAIFTPLQTGKIAMDALISKDIDVGVLVDSNIAFIGFQQNTNIQIIASISEKYDDAIIARKDNKISKPSDLIGKKVAYLPGTTSHIFLARYLHEQQIDINDLNLLTLTPPAMQAGILNGTLDAASVWQPFRYNIKKALGDKVIEFNSKSAYTAYAVLVAKTELISNHKNEIEKILQAIILAENWLKKNKDDGIIILSEELNIDKKVLNSIWDEYQLIVHLDTSLLNLIQDEGDWIRQTQNGFKDKSLPHYRDFINSEPLRSIAKERVTIK